MITRGMKLEADTAETMYECMLCGACTNDCVTGFEPPVFIREGRTESVVAGVAPKYVMDLDRCDREDRQHVRRVREQGQDRRARDRRSAGVAGRDGPLFHPRGGARPC